MKIKELFESDDSFVHPGFLTNHDQIKEWLDLYGISDYTILPNGHVDVKGVADIVSDTCKYLPVKFNTVGGRLHLVCKQLQTLEGCPHTVGGSFTVSFTNIKTLQGAPRRVEGSFGCSLGNLYLESLKGGPKYVGGNFKCFALPKLKSLDYAPLYIGGDFICDKPFTQEDIPFTEVKGSFHAT